MHPTRNNVYTEKSSRCIREEKSPGSGRNRIVLHNQKEGKPKGNLNTNETNKKYDITQAASYDVMKKRNSKRNSGDSYKLSQSKLTKNAIDNSGKENYENISHRSIKNQTVKNVSNPSPSKTASLIMQNVNTTDSRFKIPVKTPRNVLGNNSEKSMREFLKKTTNNSEPNITPFVTEIYGKSKKLKNRTNTHNEETSKKILCMNIYINYNLVIK